MKLEELVSGVRVTGVVPGEAVSVVAAQWHGTDTVELTYKSTGGALQQSVLFRDREEQLALSDAGSRAFDASAEEYRLVAEAQRISLAGLFDPMLAVATSDVRPLPHQIRAVYGEMLDRAPLRFLLADDPGAGKTIMAGLYLKELLLRDDVKRCLIVAPGGLVEQWQDELFYKFGLRFELLTREQSEAPGSKSVFDEHPLLIARMDQLARNESLLGQLADSDWDLVVVDEAHRMGAHYFGNKLEKTRRFQLGERLRDRTRHFLLMTATPHAGKEEDFQLFLTLLDQDRFAGKYKQEVHSADTTGVMRRMIKEDLLTFEGKKLFPERIAETVRYELTEDEQELYEQVTTYVREGMNRAAKLDDNRRNTVGFALTVLQRRLASSPEAILKSLERRSQRLTRHRDELREGRGATEPSRSVDLAQWEDDEHAAEEVEDVEEELLDSATTARTIEELTTELADLDRLIHQARRVRNLETDHKWVQLRTIFEDNDLLHPDATQARKLIIFTEHRDTLDYLAGKIRALFGHPESVKWIHGGVNRADRRAVTEQFSKDPHCRILLATDAAGEGLNLQAAHLVVNYDLPWNPNRIEQRFGRVHRIGQDEVCRLWNLVATNTREGAVFDRLLEKIDEQQKAYQGKVFDVLGAAFDRTPLRELLMDAIQYGDDPATRAKRDEVIDASVAEGVPELLEEQALAHESLSSDQLHDMQRQMEEARARRLQPHYLEWAFRHAFRRLGGQMARREKGRHEITRVPSGVRAVQRYGPVLPRYERVTFDLQYADLDGGPRADLLAPDHPLHDTVGDVTITQLRHVLERGTVLVSPELEEPCLLVGVVEQIVDGGTGETVAQRFGYAYVDAAGEVTPAGPAPYLDCVAAPATPLVAEAVKLPWLEDAETRARTWIIGHRLPEYLAEAAPQRQRETARLRERVDHRLSSEANRLSGEAMTASEKENAGQKPTESSESLTRKAQDLEERRVARLARLDQQAELSPKPTEIMTAALVLPLSHVEEEIPADSPVHAKETKGVERRGVDLVLATEHALGRQPKEQAFTNPGYDVLSVSSEDEPTLRIEVKARLAGSEDFHVTHNEVITGKNAAPDYRLALVEVSAQGPEHDRVRYVADPFARVDFGGLEATGVRLDWTKTWNTGRDPF